MTTDERLEEALARLPVRDLDPLAARAVGLAAERRLARTGRPPTRLERCEPPLLLGFAAAHLVWVVRYVLGV